MEPLLIVALTMLNGFFSGAEIALLSVRKTRLEDLASRGNRSARAALALRAHPEAFLATVQVGITLVGSTASALGGATLAAPLGDSLRRLGAGDASEGLALVLVVGTISVLSVVIGELVPKSISLRSSERVSLFAARPLLLLSQVARPLVWFLTACSNLLLRPFHDETSFVEGKLSADELRQLVVDATETGTLHEGAGEIASRALSLDRVRVGAVSIPRAGVAAFKREMNRSQIWEIVRGQPHARYPVVSADGIGVLGYVLTRELVTQIVEQDAIDLDSILRDMPYFSQQTPAIEVLRALQAQHQQMGAVVDEHGLLLGIVTADDITEELVGDILTENEQRETLIRPAGERAFVVRASIAVHELNRILHLDLPLDESYATLAGLLIHTTGRLLRAGEEAELPGHIRALVVEASARQIRSIELHLPQPPAEPDR